ncbi:TonB-dependent siderophore receptor [Opitutus terrae]|uniref:TonB-dependent receptor plug n=1 Tax=Opitutus terrae (strain DSM 11246 / JCM 15787 / PB90-1) TaxID=452637 RepID=B1ZNP4_OPITP|nr:TonB-dependent receptor [Opitutus terrae]ACB75414.1 TonB-dependent receptor plug [Opitutus terrae PB90-1]
MNTVTKHLAALALLATAAPLMAQSAPTADTDNEVVKLSPFLVSGGSSVGRYTSLESTSAGRVRVAIMDSSQNVSVITSEMLTDVGAGRILDATKYIAGISESTLPNAQDRTNVRGFQADGRTVDGFTYGGFMSLDPAIVDRIEVVKGPNAILAPQPTSPGGTVNNATKKPQFRNFGMVNAQVGEFDANSAFLDVNRQVNDKIAVRGILSVRDWDNWWRDSSIRSFTFMPGLTYKISDTAQLTVQYIYTDWKSSLYLGLPVDPSSGTKTKAHILAGVPKDLSVYADDIYRTDKQHDFKLLFTAELWRGIQMRFAALYHKTSQYAPQLNTGNSTGGTGGNRDPLTGNYVPGMQYLSTPPFTGSPIASGPTRIFVRSGTDPRADPRQLFLQNDYAYLARNDMLTSTTLLGFAFTESIDYGSTAYNISAPNFDIDHYTPVHWTRGTLNFDNRTSSRFLQGYLSESLSLLDNRLILNGAISKNYYRQRARGLVTGFFHGVAPEANLPSYGVVIKPYKDVFSLYYSYSEQSTSNGPTINSTTNSVPPLTSSKQNEFGVRTKLLDNKLYFTISHFDIKQDNFSVPNPANLTTPPPNPLLPALFSDRKAKGWEYELRANPTKNISIIANYTNFKNRDPNGVEFRGVAEKSGAVLVSYSFDRDTPALDGFRVAVGIDYIGNRPGDAPSGLTPASTPTNVIPNQPSFYLGARTLVNLILAYESKQNWGVQLNVDNVFDEDYMMASINRSMVYTGTPVNFRLSGHYKF